MKCNICIYWTPETGCDHYEKEVAQVVSFAHGFNNRIEETHDFVSGVKETVKYLKYLNKFSKSEQEVIISLCGGKRLPYKGVNGYALHERHKKAIESLKEKGAIVKGDDYILKLVYLK